MYRAKRTVAIIVSLGHHNAGLFASDDALAERLLASGRASGETLWRMPLDAAYDKQIDSDIADMKNVRGRDCGSVTAAQFLQTFWQGLTWAILDIRCFHWCSTPHTTTPYCGTGYRVTTDERGRTDPTTP